MGLPHGVGHRWRSCCPWKGCRDAIWMLERNFLPRSASQFMYTVPDLPCVRSTMPVSSRGPRRRIVPSDPHRNPGPRRVDHLNHYAPVTVSKSSHNPGSQHSDHRTLCRAPEHTHAERQKTGGNPPSQRADHTDHNDQAIQSSR